MAYIYTRIDKNTDTNATTLYIYLSISSCAKWQIQKWLIFIRYHWIKYNRKDKYLSSRIFSIIFIYYFPIIVILSDIKLFMNIQ